MADRTSQRRRARERVTRAHIAELVGDIEDIKAAKIIATGATVEDLEEAAAWAAGETDVLGEARRRGSPIVNAIYDILTAEDKFGDDRD